MRGDMVAGCGKLNRAAYNFGLAQTAVRLLGGIHLPKKLFFVPIMLAAIALWAADNISPLNVKEGLWEVTSSHTMSGAGMTSVSPETLARMPPEQRAKLEAMMNGTPTTEVRKECITKEKLAMHSAFSNNRGECTRTVVSSTGSKLEVKFHCADKQWSSDGTFKMDAVGSDNVKGTMHMVANSNGHAMNMDFTINSKYLGSDCGDVK
jgi:hypothetical protein